MHDKRILIGLLFVLIILGFLMLFASFKNIENEPVKTDAMLINEEYSALNGKINESNQKAYPKVELKDDNVFKKASEEEVIDIISNKTGIIYFGFPTCSWCRTLMPILNDVAKSLNVGQIYYLDILNIRDTLDLDDNNKPIIKEQGSKGYYKILELLDDKLDPYILTTKDNQKIDTQEKRLYSPTVLVVKEGKVLDIHVGTISSQKSGFDELNPTQKEELKTILNDMLQKINVNTCQEEAC